MDCSEAKPELERFASERLTPIERVPIEEHVSMCEECSLEVERIRAREGSPAAGDGGASDWTVEKIFGARDDGAAPRTGGARPVEGVMQGPFAASSGSEDDAAAGTIGDPSAAPPADSRAVEPHAAPRALEPPAPAPRAEESHAAPFPPAAAERPSMILPLPPADADVAPAAPRGGAPNVAPRERRPRRDAESAAEGWDFEPAGAKVEQTPPDETVQLAETALGKRKERSRARSAATRALLWGFGGLAGLVLLGASAWLALTVHRTPVPPTVARPHGGGAKTGAKDPEARGIAASDSASAPAPAPAPVPLATDAGQSAAPSEPPGPPPSVVTNPPGVAPRTLAPQAAAPARVHDAAKPPATAAKPPATAAKSSVRPAAPPAPSGGTLARATTPPSAPGTTSGSAKKASRPLDDDHDMWPIDDPPAAARPRAGPTPAPSATEKPAPSGSAEGRSTTPAPAPPAHDSAIVQPQPAQPEPPAQPAKPATPLDRLHEATALAAGAGDLVALRKLREAWKNQLRTVVGPERSRTKREYADCLWAIQLLSGRRDDQRAALLAYREFLVSAPAGGTDARSAARLRQLEDVTAERR